MVRRKRWRDPFADYIEWTNNRYNPGHYLGGNLPPELNKSAIGPKGRRLAGLLLAVSAVLSLVSLLAFAPFLREVSRAQVVVSVVVWLALVGLTAAAALSMYRSGQTAAKTRRHSNRGSAIR